MHFVLFVRMRLMLENWQSSYLAVTAIMGIALCHGLVYGIHALFVVMSCLQMILSMSKGETEELVASEWQLRSPLYGFEIFSENFIV